MERKENRKIRYTRKAIKESFLELLKNKRFDQITVKEITELADINRATFYAHYTNMEALTKEIETEMAEQVIAAMDKLYRKSNYESDVVETLFDALAQKKEMCMWVLGDKVTGCGTQMIYDYARKLCVPRWKEKKKLTDEQAERFLEYLYHGSLAYIKRWYEAGFSGNIGDYKRQFKEIVHHTLRYIYDTP